MGGESKFIKKISFWGGGGGGGARVNDLLRIQI